MLGRRAARRLNSFIHGGASSDMVVPINSIDAKAVYSLLTQLARM